MQSVKLIRILSFLWLGLFLATLAISDYLVGRLPEDLRNYHENLAQIISSDFRLYATAFGYVLLWLHAIATLGLAFSQRWAGKFYLIGTTLLYFVSFFMVPIPQHQVAYSLDQLSIFISGAIFTLLILLDLGYDIFSKSE